MNAPAETRALQARALLVGHRLDLRRFQQVQPLATTPLTLEVAGGGLAILFRFGAVVFFDVKPMQEAAFLEDLAPFVVEPLAQPETSAAPVSRRHEGTPVTMTNQQVILSSRATSV